MLFEFDDKKNETNALKHGIDFDSAKTLWNDADMLVIPAQSATEARFIEIGIIDGKYWCCIHTMRGDSVRIISCRRARNNERKLYDNAK